MRDVGGITWSADGAGGSVLQFGGCSHRGAVRETNEDNWLMSPPVFVVADGMGGHKAGDVASAIVVERFTELARLGDFEVDAVEGCIAECQQRIALLDDGSGRAPGSTVVAAVYVLKEEAGYWLVVNIGDSRAYAWTESSFEQVTRDHTVVQEMIESGALDALDAARHPERHVITRALGPFDVAAAEYSLIPATGGSMLLLCSDGVSSELADDVLMGILQRGLGAQETAEEVVRTAVDTGGHDNATAVVVEVRNVTARPDGTVVRSPIEEITLPNAWSGS